MADVVIAAHPGLVGPDERAFVEHISRPTGRWDTYSSVLTPDDCLDIDQRAYREARSWYRTAGGGDRTEIDGVSLGKAFEWVATTELIRLHRAHRVLEHLVGSGARISIDLRGVTREWAYAADTLGLRFVGNRPEQAGVLSGSRIQKPSRLVRAAAKLLSFGTPSPRVGLVYGRSWALPYARALAARWPLVTVDPGPRYLAGMLAARKSMRAMWLHDGVATSSGRSENTFATSHPYLGGLWRSTAGELIASQRMGRALGSQVPALVACQDVLPPERALLLGAQRAGAQIITLEHGISGLQNDEITTVGRVFGVWGEPHIAHHRPLAPASTRVEVVGWPRLEGMQRARRLRQRWDVVYFAQPSHGLAAGSWPEDELRALETVEAFAAAHPNLAVGVKFHPSTTAFGGTESPLQHCRRVRGDSLRVLQRARTAVVSLSTTGIEAMSLGVPVVSLRTIAKLGGINFINESQAPEATDSGELAALLEPLLTDGSERSRSVNRGCEYARRFIAGLDQPGSAAKRLTALVDSVL